MLTPIQMNAARERLLSSLADKARREGYTEDFFNNEQTNLNLWLETLIAEHWEAPDAFDAAVDVRDLQLRQNVVFRYDGHGEIHFSSNSGSSFWKQPASTVNAALAKYLRTYTPTLLAHPEHANWYVRGCAANLKLGISGTDIVNGGRLITEFTAQVDRSTQSTGSTIFYDFHGFPDALGNGKPGIGKTKSTTGHRLEF